MSLPQQPVHGPSRRMARRSHAGFKARWLIVTIVVNSWLVILGVADASYLTGFIAVLVLPAADLALVTGFGIASWRARRAGADVPGPGMIILVTSLFVGVSELVLLNVETHGC